MIDRLRTVLAYRDLIQELVSRDLKVRYRRSALGFLWTMLQPLLTMLVLSVVFSAIFRRMRRMIFPERVFGRPGAHWM